MRRNWPKNLERHILGLRMCVALVIATTTWPIKNRECYSWQIAAIISIHLQHHNLLAYGFKDPKPHTDCTFSVLLDFSPALTPSKALNLTMSFSNLVSDIAFRDAHPDDRSSQISHARSQATARSYTSTTATSVSISGDISSQLHAGYSHPLSRSWQAERQLTKVWTVLYNQLFSFSAPSACILINPDFE